MKYIEFKNELENDKEYPVYLFEGEDAFFRESGVALLKNKFVAQPELNFVNLDIEFDIGQLIASLEGYPFMSKKRMTLVREFYPKQERFNEGLKNYLENPFNESLLVIVNEKSSDNFKKFSNVCVVDCSKVDISLLIRWIKGKCKSFNVEIDGETAKSLSEFCLCDMTRIKTETEKLISYVGDGGTITLKDIEQMVSKDLEYKIYELTDYIAKKNFEEALAVIKDMISKGEQSTRLLSYIYNYFRKLLHVAISDMRIEEMAKSFAVKEYAIKKMKEQSEMFKKRSLKNAVDTLCDADYKIKSGLADAEDYSYLTIFKIMTEK